MKMRFERHGLVVELDPTEVFPNDPGQGTPVMVYWPEKGLSGTFFCVLDSGMIDDYPLSERRLEWLSSLEEEVAEWFDSLTGEQREA